VRAVTLACLPRTPEALTALVEKLDPAHNPLWKKRDITGDGVDETFCNQFLEAALELLEAPVPRGLLARQQIEWLDSDVGKAHGWKAAMRAEAFQSANYGRPVVAGWLNPAKRADGSHRPSHVALCVPTGFGRELQIAQAGQTNFNSEGVSRGFGGYPVRFWVHE